jgi:hypothetical protein
MPGISDYPASDQSGTGMKQNNDAGSGTPMKSGIFFGPVPD